MTDAGEKATLIKEYHITLDMAKELGLYAPDFSGTYTNKGKFLCLVDTRFAHGSCCPNRCIQIWIHLLLVVRTWYECQQVRYGSCCLGRCAEKLAHLNLAVRTWYVCRDIENLNLEYGKLSLPKVGECDYTADNGQTYREFRL